MKIKINQHQYNALRKIWLYCFGNNCKHCTMANHKFIQNILESNQDNREFFVNGLESMRSEKEHPLFKYPEKHFQHILTDECIKTVDLILKNEIDEAIRFAKSL